MRVYANMCVVCCMCWHFLWWYCCLHTGIGVSCDVTGNGGSCFVLTATELPTLLGRCFPLLCSWYFLVQARFAIACCYFDGLYVVFRDYVFMYTQSSTLCAFSVYSWNKSKSFVTQSVQLENSQFSNSHKVSKFEWLPILILFLYRLTLRALTLTYESC